MHPSSHCFSVQQLQLHPCLLVRSCANSPFSSQFAGLAIQFCDAQLGADQHLGVKPEEELIKKREQKGMHVVAFCLISPACAVRGYSSDCNCQAAIHPQPEHKLCSTYADSVAVMPSKGVM